jgi:hypothetical protein
MAETKAKYRVREGFTLHPYPEGEPVEAGTVLELTDEEALRHAVQIELVPITKAKAAKATSDAAG